AARITSSTTSSGPGAGGSGTFSIRTSRGPWNTAALTRSALDLDLDVAARVSRRVERRRAFVQRERGREQRRRVDAARRHEADRARPQPGRADDPANPERLRLHEADLDRGRAPDIDPDEHDPRARPGDREGARHRRRNARSFDYDVESTPSRQLGHL